MHAVGMGRERHVDAVIDDKRHPNDESAALIARASSIMARVSLLLSRNCTKRCSAFGDAARQVNHIVAPGALGIDDGVEPHINRLHDTLARWRNVA